MTGSLEIRLFNFIRSLHQEIVDMKPEDGFSSPRDLELVTEVNKKSAVFDKLQEAMQIYNPDFNYEPKQEDQKDFSKNSRFDPNWKEKQIAYSKEDTSRDYFNVWAKHKTVKVEELLGAFEFTFDKNIDLSKTIPSILNAIKDCNVVFSDLFLFTLVDKRMIINEKLYGIKYDEVDMLFLYSNNIDISNVKDDLNDYFIMVLTKSNNRDNVRFLFKIDFEGL